MFLRVQGAGGGMDWAFGAGICTMQFMERLASGDLLSSTEISAWYSVIIYVGKESEREWCVYMCDWVEKPLQSCRLTILD